MQLCPPIGSSSEVLLKDLLLKKILNSIAFNCPKFLQALRILLTSWDWNERTSWDCVNRHNQNMKMIISVSVFKIYKEYLDFTLHYLAGIIWKWLNIHCPFDLNGKPAGSGPFVGAIGGPCNGHLSLSQVWLVEPLDVGQKNSSPWSEQTWAPSPKKKILSATMLICQCTKPQAVLSKNIVMHLRKKEKYFSIFWSILVGIIISKSTSRQ